jgi:Zn-dependent protease with chaperone function
MNPDIAAHVLLHHRVAASAFRIYVGYPLFGSAIQTLWPLFLMPALAGLFAQAVARRLPHTPATWLPAALLAALPGLLALAELWLVMTPSIMGGIDNWKAWMLAWITPIIGCLLLAHALHRAALRSFETRRLFRASVTPGPRLRRAAERLGLVVRELPIDEKECFVAGVLRPTVYVSRGALARLGEAELLAALHHERAHVRGRDTLVLCLLSCLADLAPLAPRGSIEAYQMAREAAADQAAVAGAGKLDLASALLALARPGPAPIGSLPMAKTETLRWRLQAILESGDALDRGWLTASLAVGAAALLLAWPCAQVVLHDVFCWS